MKKYKFLSTILTAFLLFSATGCLSDLDVKSIDPRSTSELDVDALFVKIYATMATTGQKGPADDGDVAGIDEGTSSFYRLIYSLNEFSSDLIYWIWPDVGVDDIRNATWTPNNSLLKGMFARLYFDITLCNLYLEQTEGMTGNGIEIKRAEARFIRALNYYYVLDFFGNAAKCMTISSENPQRINRTDLYNWLVTEIKEFEPALADAGNRVSYYRVDKAAAWLLLSRIYLNAEVYTGTADWDNAALYSKKVISSPYELASKYEYLFMGDNDDMSAVNDAYKEIILPIGQDGLHTRSYGGSMFLIASHYTAGLPSWGITESWKCIRSRYELVKLFFPAAAKYDNIDNAFIKGDASVIIPAAVDSRAMFCNYTADAAHSWFLGRQNKDDEFFSGWAVTKFSNAMADPARRASDSQHPDMDIPFMRQAEAYLTYAEAVLRGATQIDGYSADDAVNKIRHRANATDKAGVTLQDILDERGREFYSEGQRRTDLVRFKKFGGNSNYYWEWKGGAYLGQHFDSWRDLYPIPQSELTANPNLKPQNTGYDI